MSSDETAESSGAQEHSFADLLFYSRSSIGAGGVFAIVLAVASTAVALLGIAGLTNVAGILLALLLVALALLSLPVDLADATTQLGQGSETRLMALITLGVIGLHQHRLDAFAWVTVVLLAGVVIGESALKRLHLYTVNRVANLAGHQQRVDRLPSALIPVLTLLALALGWAAVMFGLSWLPALVVTAGVGALAATDLVARVNRLRFDQRNRAALARAVREHAPVFALYWKADAGTDYQISMWLPYLERLGLPFVVIVRTVANFAEAAALTSAPVLLRRAMADLDTVVVPSLKTVFYVNNAAANSQMVRYPGLTHIMLNHGDSDKAPSYNPVSRMYDKNFVAGQAAVDRFTSHGVAISPSQFAIVGRPQIEDVDRATVAVSEVSRPRVLYAPTWAGFTADAAYSSLPWGVQLVSALIERGCEVVFRPHPYAYRSHDLTQACADIAALLKADTERGHVWGEQAEKTWSLSDCFNNSDAMISDVSGVVADYLYSGKPLAMVAVHASREAFAAEFPLAEAAYILEATASGISELEGTLDLLLRDDPLASERRRLRTYYLGDPGDQPYPDLFFDEVRKYL